MAKPTCFFFFKVFYKSTYGFHGLKCASKKYFHWKHVFKNCFHWKHVQKLFQWQLVSKNIYFLDIFIEDMHLQKPVIHLKISLKTWFQKKNSKRIVQCSLLENWKRVSNEMFSETFLRRNCAFKKSFRTLFRVDTTFLFFFFYIENIIFFKHVVCQQYFWKAF